MTPTPRAACRQRPRACGPIILLVLLLLAAPATAGLRLDPAPAWRHAPDMNSLMAILDDWLDAASPLPRKSTAPQIRLVDEARAMALGGPSMRGHGRRRGLYDADTATIYLVRPWDPRAARDVSVLVHELVHHRQAGAHFYCPAAQEPQAYALQADWLAARGLDLDWPRLAVTLAAGCTPRDIHPD